MTASPIKNPHEVGRVSSDVKVNKRLDERLRYLVMTSIRLWHSDIRGLCRHAISLMVESGFLIFQCFLIWFTMCARCFVSICNVVPGIKQVFQHSISICLSSVIAIVSKSGLIASVAIVKRTPHIVAKSASDFTNDLPGVQKSLILDVSAWEDPESFIQTIVALNESGVALTGHTNPRYCFVVSTDTSRSDPLILFISLILSFMACARYSILNQKLPRYFPLFQDVPTSKISSIEEVSAQ